MIFLRWISFRERDNRPLLLAEDGFFALALLNEQEKSVGHRTPVNRQQQTGAHTLALAGTNGPSAWEKILEGPASQEMAVLQRMRCLWSGKSRKQSY